MRRFRQRGERGSPRGDASGFTLIELIIVMLLLAVAASLVAPKMSSFFRGRALNHEVRRMLSLTHYAQSRAVADGVPVVLWFDGKASTYGVEVQAGHATDEDRTRQFTAEPTLTISAGTTMAAATPVSEQEDEGFGMPEGRAAIRFTPDGFIDEVSVRSIVVQQGDGDALELALKENRLGYEIRPVAKTN